MADRTGIANGTLRPCVYFSRIPDMYIILPPVEIGGGLELARMAFERKYKHSWIWCEATTLAEIDRLQKRLTEQELREASKKIHVNAAMRDRAFKKTGDDLARQLSSSSTSQFEKDWIRAYFQLREDKRDCYRDSLMHRNYFLVAREMDSSRNTDDLLPPLPGQFERTASGGAPLEVVKQIEEHNAKVAAMGA